MIAKLDYILVQGSGHLYRDNKAAGVTVYVATNEGPDCVIKIISMFYYIHLSQSLTPGLQEGKDLSHFR